MSRATEMSKESFKRAYFYLKLKPWEYTVEGDYGCFMYSPSGWEALADALLVGKTTLDRRRHVYRAGESLIVDKAPKIVSIKSIFQAVYDASWQSSNNRLTWLRKEGSRAWRGNGTGGTPHAMRPVFDEVKGGLTHPERKAIVPGKKVGSLDALIYQEAGVA
jgi:hypothetical protein